MRFILCLYLTALSACGLSQSNTYQGEYRNGGSTSEDAYQLLQIHYTKNGTIFFYLEAGRGAPSYNSGAMYGKLTMNKKTRHLQYIPKDTTEDCSLDFALNKDKIVVTTTSGECQFGYGVLADGSYKMVKKSNPIYFIDRKGQKIFFDKTDPEHYEL